jgi:hypothetical protein
MPGAEFQWKRRLEAGLSEKRGRITVFRFLDLRNNFKKAVRILKMLWFFVLGTSFVFCQPLGASVLAGDAI